MSKERIVEAAIEILDTEGESALTFRALSARLQTGSGAIYWHVANKDALLALAADRIIGAVMATVVDDDEPGAAIRTLALGVFDAIDAHPWIGAQLSREPWQSALMQIFEGVGSRLDALGVPVDEQFDAASALVNYILGLAGQYAAGARMIPSGTDRATFLASVADRWAGLDAERYPFMRRVAAGLAAHDDREQFRAGIDLILAGITALR